MAAGDCPREIDLGRAVDGVQVAPGIDGLAPGFGFDVRHDHYGSTHSAHNRALCAEIWGALRQKGLIAERAPEDDGGDPQDGASP